MQKNDLIRVFKFKSSKWASNNTHITETELKKLDIANVEEFAHNTHSCMCRACAHKHTQNANKHTTQGTSINLTYRLIGFSKGSLWATMFCVCGWGLIIYCIGLLQRSVN